MNIRYKYHRIENKPTVLFLHGWGGNENSFDITYNNLHQNFSLLSINLSDITTNYLDKSLTMHDYVLAVLRILKKHNICNCHIVCHSFGFRVALILARDGDIHIDSMIIIDGAGIKCQSVITKFKILKYKILKKLVKAKLLPSRFIANRGSNDYNILSDRDKITFCNIVNYDLKDCVKYIDCDTTIIWGKYDRDTCVKCAKYIHKNIKNSKLIIYNAGHFSFIENQIEFIMDIDAHFSKYLII